ncbi:periplasmic nitrate reductase maturation protein NapF [Magnetococcus marinus MC-1]|uniref:Ferredoxin-type protein NapF n=2 Tax=Magnetococcus TaxID=162171 RepID=A0L809_MAGMM|nr:periplasmic nitrate reductase maturation protein NapF [Magnetococcus marinus MC-1]
MWRWALATPLRRRDLLRGSLQTHHPTPQRPPWAVEEPLFLRLCDRCDRCLEVCPSRLLVRGEGGYPQVDYQQGACDFCDKCRQACRPGALSMTQTQPWQRSPHIAQTCLPLRGVACQSCRDACEPMAIRFPPVLGGIARPQVERDRCNGCGACVAPCPVAALSMITTRSDAQPSVTSLTDEVAPCTL